VRSRSYGLGLTRSASIKPWKTDKTSVVGVAAWRFALNEGGGFATAFQGAARGRKVSTLGPAEEGHQVGEEGKCSLRHAWIVRNDGQLAHGVGV
jgi:hypothetical protein